MSDGYLDSNMLLRHITHDHPSHSPRATALLHRVERRELRLRTSDPVIFEAAFTLQSFYKASREQIRDALLPLIDLPGIELPNKRVFRRVFALFVETSLSFADCYSAALMEQDGETVIYSFDRGYDRLQDKSAVRQAEPG